MDKRRVRVRCGPWRRRLSLVAAGLVLVVPALRAADEPRRAVTVLALYADAPQLPANQVLDASLRRRLEAGAAGRQITVFTEFLDAVRFSGPEQEALRTQYLAGKYASYPPDVILAAGPLAVDFLLERRATLFPGVPVVHAVLTPEQAAAVPVEVAGVPSNFDPGPTLELALRLQPHARRLVTVTGSSKFDVKWAEMLRAATARLGLESRLEVRRLEGLPLERVLDDVGSVTGEDVVFFASMFQDGSGRSHIPREVLGRMAQRTRAPIFAVYSTYLGSGAAGGVMPTFEAIGEQAADVVLERLRSPAGRLSLPPAVAVAPVFDWRQLRRFGLASAPLPEGARVLFRTPTFWEQYRWHVMGLVTLCVLEGALIASLLAQRRRTRVAQARVRETDEQMRLAAEAAGVGMWVWDMASGQIWGTDKAQEIYGTTGREFIPFDDFLALVHAEDRPLVLAAVEQAVSVAARFTSEYRVVRPDGVVRWVAVRGQVERGPGGAPARMRGVSVDVTERKRVERELQEKRNELVHAARVGVLGELSGSLAHELNQPLTAILSNAQAAEQLLRRDPPDLAEVADIVADIISEDKRAGEVIRRMRALLVRGEMQRQALDLNPLVTEVLRIIRVDLMEREVSVEADLAEPLPQVAGDGVQLQQVVMNLLLNAADAMRGLAPDARRVRVSTAVPGPGRVRVCVEDEGPGLPPGGEETVFAPFFSTKSGGLGLGLLVCRNIVDAHGGTLTAANRDGGGARFCFDVPVMAEAVP